MAHVQASTLFAHGLLTIAIGLNDRLIVAADHTAGMIGTASNVPSARAIELAPGFVAAASGIWSTVDGTIDARREMLAAYRPGDTAETYLQRYDRLYRNVLENWLTHRFREAPEQVLRDCFAPLTPPQSLMACEVVGDERTATILEYIPTLTAANTIVLTPLLQAQPGIEGTAFAAIGAAAPFIDVLDRTYIDQALRGSRGPENAARILIEHALSRTHGAATSSAVQTFPVVSTDIRIRRRRPARRFHSSGSPNAHQTAEQFPPVDTKDITAVEQFVHQSFDSLYPGARFSWLPKVFKDVANFFAGRDPDYATVDLRYHDLEHTLQATVCLTQLLVGRHAARIVPRIDAHHFELAITAALLHDSGYLKLRSDTRGTGAKYTFCHVLRGCAFAASYLPTIGAKPSDVETVMGAINCTGPMNEISRLRFQAPVDEIIGCAVATADYLGQMAAIDYPDELEILFSEFQESDDFLHVPVENRMFKSAADLMARTPHFWHRFVLPKLESDFHGVYRFLAKPYPDGPNAYVQATEANIAEIQRRMRASSTPEIIHLPAAPDTAAVATTHVVTTPSTEPSQLPASESGA
ncbi:MAG TPA: hypothetical protein VHE61_24250 [Opitutaceae bacterium]|nr:hypothetical protein [Opitutaceae bacterium]